MNVTGIVVEYNPFHNGHLYHINESKRVTGADVIVAVMSGNFLQRGEPAVADKWSRAAVALKHGADIVFELPTVYATQNAQTFAFGAVSLLDQLQCVHSLCFGSESGSIQELQSVSSILADEPEEFKGYLQKFLSAGLSYPKAMHEALAMIGIPLYQRNSTAQPNNTLGLMYLLALHKLKSSITPVTIQRIAAEYHQETITSDSIASATAIRKLANTGSSEQIKEYVPDAITALFSNTYRTMLHWDHFQDLLFYKIYSMNIEELRDIIDVDEGMEYRLKKIVGNANSVNELIEMLKVKRFTWTRIQRMLVHILLDMKKSKLASLQVTPYARILGFTDQGRQLLQIAKKKSAIPLVTKWGKQQLLYADYDHVANRIYSLIEQQHRRDDWSLSQLIHREFSKPPIQQ
ncbi:hypothetical protein BHU72_03035 [Desulfuribacillus stibiiarsenatis]|uniref:tRNA(Met) cytidine acetate ligase n=1 Tax=Desulfuribacillus stibiiarsenatis TaxID=1390249 RepID=A0A1E5L6M0_9FIRM|nr:nucleotidyltransferase [Desulfuribacillus stibiiarsenatis]OEH85771.1 hypothetical protein BHU72_03035 [Desulfuribacillus stibiiarsenatis]